MAEALLKSAYEVARDQRLQRNKGIMASLGLLLHGNLTEDNKTSEEDLDEKVESKKRARQPKAKQEATRRSKRVQGLGPDGLPVPVSPAAPSHEFDEEEDDAERRMQLKIARLKALHEENKTTYKNQTATYEHTWMRVRTMSDQALARRIKVIENALGQHCVVKMRMFAEVLVLAEKFELAKQAEESLNRLLELGLK